MTLVVPEHVKALIFDCDGTLVDSMPLHMEAWEQAIKLQGGEWDYGFFFSQKGKREEDIVAEYDRRFGRDLDPAGTVQKKHEYFRARIQELQPVTRVVDIARRYQGVLPMAVASGSTKQTVMLELDTLGLTGLFDLIITADDDVRAKPSPDIFLEAARRLGIGPESCQVFEDGDLGLEAARTAGMLATDIRLRLSDIHLRDPFVLREQDCYYLYGTRGATVWTEAEGFDCYSSDDLVAWEGPREIFRRDADFWADRSFWAPECFAYDGAYYLVATFGAGDGRLAVQILKAGSPLGPFKPWSDGPVTPKDWECLDATLYFDSAETPYLVFSRSFRQAGGGCVYAVGLTPDLRASQGEVSTLFRAADAPWVKPFPFAKEFGVDGEVYLADGPFLYKTRSEQLLLLWSSFGAGGYTVGVARSAGGDIQGPWTHEPEPLFTGDGGHCMLFRSKEGKLLMALHAPNEKDSERPQFVELAEAEDRLVLVAPTGGAKGEPR